MIKSKPSYISLWTYYKDNKRYAALETNQNISLMRSRSNCAHVGENWKSHEKREAGNTQGQVIPIIPRKPRYPYLPPISRIYPKLSFIKHIVILWFGQWTGFAINNASFHTSLSVSVMKYICWWIKMFTKINDALIQVLKMGGPNRVKHDIIIRVPMTRIFL